MQRLEFLINMAYVCSIHNKKLYALPILMKGFLTDPKFAFEIFKKDLLEKFKFI